ncbi:meiotic recombination protein REC114-like isoform X2 [Antedon mediterranea]|uniref:meiotic recombination protein REC114-like isoform X2 n=1 Tax=Antedon mediterranea TaxID=105859 RepID=UPI003AF91A2E
MMASVSRKSSKGKISDHKRMNLSRVFGDSQDFTSYTVWQLSRYARFIYNSAEKNELQGTWKIYENKDGKLELHLKDDQLIVTQDDLILNESRRFRLQFESTPETTTSAQNCADFLTAIQGFVNFRSMETHLGEMESGDKKLNKQTLQGETTLSNIAKALTTPGEVNLPLAYKHAHIADGDLPTLVRMILTDANFPAFVGAVEQELNAIMQ